MATATKPLALDESINTTELTPRNIADVLAEGLDDIVQALGGGGGVVGVAYVEITIPSSGNDMSITMPAGYDNTNCIPLTISRIIPNEEYFNPDRDYYYTYYNYDSSNPHYGINLHYADSQRGNIVRVYFLKIS